MIAFDYTLEVYNATSMVIWKVYFTGNGIHFSLRLHTVYRDIFEVKLGLL